MEIIIIILLIVITIGLGATLFVLQSKISELKNQSSVELIKTDVVELGRTIAKLMNPLAISWSEVTRKFRLPCRNNCQKVRSWWLT